MAPLPADFVFMFMDSCHLLGIGYKSFNKVGVEQRSLDLEISFGIEKGGIDRID